MALPLSSYTSTIYMHDLRDDDCIRLAKNYRFLEYDVQRMPDYVDLNYSRGYARDDSVVYIKLRMDDYRTLAKNDLEGERLWNNNSVETKLRRKYPALQDAWDKYQMLLALVNQGESNESY
jgi:hypothetical protein